MTLKGCTKAELLWLIDWMCTHSMFWHDIEIERALNALELEREQKKLDEADRLNEESARLRQQAAELLTPYEGKCALPGFVDSKNEEKTERNAGYLVVSHSGGGMLRQGTRKGIRRTPANRGMRAHRIVKGLDISEDVCHGMCP